MITRKILFKWILAPVILLGIIAAIYFMMTCPQRRAGRMLAKAGTEGGLVVHVNCGKGRLTAALNKGTEYVVQGISNSGPSVNRARKHIQKKGLYGRVSVDLWSEEDLPYASGLVNLLIIDQGKDVSREEIMRVLAPLGKALVKEDGKWIMLEKPWPSQIDEWTHYAHGPDGNMVAMDSVVAPPEHIKWMAKPYWGRDHRYGNNIAMVSAAGRLFYIDNELPQESVEYLPDRPFLVARDAFSGVMLWKKPVYPRLPVDLIRVKRDPEKYMHYEPLFPVELKMVAEGDKLYLAFGKQGEIQVLDASSGELLRTFPGTEHTEEIILSDGILVTVVPESEDALQEMKFTKAQLPYGTHFRMDRGTILRAIDPRTGKFIWEHHTAKEGGLEVSPVIREGQVYAIIGNRLVKMDLFTGRRIWEKELSAEPAKANFRSVAFLSGPSVFDRLIATDEVVFMVFSNRSILRLDAFSSDTGEHLWGRECKAPKYAGTSAFVVGDKVWVHMKYPEIEKNVQGRPSNQLYPVTSLDVRTGRELERYNAEKIFDIDHHHRCYGDRATNSYLLTGRRGVEFTSFGSGEIRLNHWVRGKCRFGVLPCNGLLYSLPHGCSCYPFDMMKGYAALAPAEEWNISREDFNNMKGRLKKGPFYGSTGTVRTSGIAGKPDEWRTYRHDPRRSGSTISRVEPEGLDKVVWETLLDGQPGALTAAGGRLFVCVPETHQIQALDLSSGKHLWSFVAGSRVDSPPTIYNGLVLFGSRDGYVYCLRADNGGLVWRFRAAPADRKIVNDDHPESIWPVHGAVLVKDGRLYVSAGRSSLLDMGIALHALEPETGRVLASSRIYDDYAQIEREMIGNVGHRYDEDLGVWNDILIGTDTSIYLRQLQMDKNFEFFERPAGHLISLNGLLNPNWFSRIGVFFGEPSKASRGPSGTYDFMDSPRQGSYLVYDRDRTYSVRIHPNMGKFKVSFKPGREGYRIFADDNLTEKNIWNILVPMRVQAMVATGGSTLFMAGPPDMVDRDDPWAALQGEKGGLLWAVSAEDGSRIAEYRLNAPPVFDGMIAAGGRLYLSAMDGRVICLGNSN